MNNSTMEVEGIIPNDNYQLLVFNWQSTFFVAEVFMD